jgi:hypothetical protein
VLRTGYAPGMTRLAPILVCLLAFFAASCGGDDDGGDDAPSRQEFAERADEICRQAVQSLEEVGEGADTPQDIVDAVDGMIEESRDSIDQLANLERPEGAAGETAQEFVEATRSELEEEGIPALEQLRDAVEDRDQQAVAEAVARLQNLDTRESTRAAQEIGADDCADE